MKIVVLTTEIDLNSVKQKLAQFAETTVKRKIEKGSVLQKMQARKSSFSVMQEVKTENRTHQLFVLPNNKWGQKIEAEIRALMEESPEMVRDEKESDMSPKEWFEVVSFKRPDTEIASVHDNEDLKAISSIINGDYTYGGQIRDDSPISDLAVAQFNLKKADVVRYSFFFNESVVESYFILGNKRDVHKIVDDLNVWYERSEMEKL
jgi:hypothetical protein